MLVDGNCNYSFQQGNIQYLSQTPINATTMPEAVQLLKVASTWMFCGEEGRLLDVARDISIKKEVAERTRRGMWRGRNRITIQQHDHRPLFGRNWQRRSSSLYHWLLSTILVQPQSLQWWGTLGVLLLLMHPSNSQDCSWRYEIPPAGFCDYSPLDVISCQYPFLFSIVYAIFWYFIASPISEI